MGRVLPAPPYARGRHRLRLAARHRPGVDRRDRGPRRHDVVPAAVRVRRGQRRRAGAAPRPRRAPALPRADGPARARRGHRADPGQPARRPRRRRLRPGRGAARRSASGCGRSTRWCSRRAREERRRRPAAGVGGKYAGRRKGGRSPVTTIGQARARASLSSPRSRRGRACSHGKCPKSRDSPRVLRTFRHIWPSLSRPSGGRGHPVQPWGRGVRVPGIDECLLEVMTLPGARGAAIVDWTSGLALGTVGESPGGDHEATAAETAEVARAAAEYRRSPPRARRADAAREPRTARGSPVEDLIVTTPDRLPRSCGSSRRPSTAASSSTSGSTGTPGNLALARIRLRDARRAAGAGMNATGGHVAPRPPTSPMLMRLAAERATGALLRDQRHPVSRRGPRRARGEPRRAGHRRPAHRGRRAAPEGWQEAVAQAGRRQRGGAATS